MPPTEKKPIMDYRTAVERHRELWALARSIDYTVEPTEYGRVIRLADELGGRLDRADARHYAVRVRPVLALVTVAILAVWLGIVGVADGFVASMVTIWVLPYALWSVWSSSSGVNAELRRLVGEPEEA